MLRNSREKKDKEPKRDVWGRPNLAIIFLAADLPTPKGFDKIDDNGIFEFKLL